MEVRVDRRARYSASHEWARLDGDEAVVGITDYAQHELSDVVFVELPAIGETVTREDLLCTLESVKAIGEVLAPISGTVIAVNGALDARPEMINMDPYGEGWVARLAPGEMAEMDDLMDADAYLAYLSGPGKEAAA